MPKVNDGEDRSHYMARCVRVVMAEGLDQKAAVGKCEGMYDSATKSLSKAAKIARNLIHNPKDESDRTEGVLPDAGDKIAKGGYKNPPEEDDVKDLLRGTCVNPANAVARDMANEALRVHRDHALEIFDLVYKQSRMAGSSFSEAREHAEVAKSKLDMEHRTNLRMQIAVEKARLSRMGGIR